MTAQAPPPRLKPRAADKVARTAGSPHNRHRLALPPRKTKRLFADNPREASDARTPDMTDDTIILLQNVKQAEEEKARAIAQAHQQAETRVQAAAKASENVEEDTRRRLAAEQPALKAEVDARLKKDLQALEDWRRKALQALRDAASRNKDRALDAARDAFLNEWRQGV